MFEAAGKNLDEAVGNSGLILKRQDYSIKYKLKLENTYTYFLKNGYKFSEHALNRVFGRIAQGKIESVEQVLDVLKTGTKYADTVDGGIVIFKNGISVHIADDGVVKTVIGNAKVKNTWEEIV